MGLLNKIAALDTRTPEQRAADAEAERQAQQRAEQARVSGSLTQHEIAELRRRTGFRKNEILPPGGQRDNDSA